MAIMSDNKSNGPQFSKVLVLLLVVIGIIGIAAMITIGILFSINETILIAGISAFGATSLTAETFYLKKSQAENTTRMYVEAYKEIAQMSNDDSIIETVENNIIDKMDSSLSENLSDATSLIEKQTID